MNKKSKQPSKAALGFAHVVTKYRYQNGPTASTMPLTNFTFFTGAGFSKSWDPNAPVGKELFSLSTSDFNDIIEEPTLYRQFGIGTGDKINLNDLRQIIYQLDMYEKYPDVCSRYFDPQNIQILRAALRTTIVNRYKSLAKLNFFDESISKFPLNEASPSQIKMLEFFEYLKNCATGSDFFSEGIRFNFASTNYDFVIETILDNILDAEDSLFLYTYRGFTPKRIASILNPAITHNHWLLDHLIKLNGGFEIIRADDEYALDYTERDDADIFEFPPILMLPSREQDYSDPYFQTIFPKAIRLMRDSTVLVLVGYSMPDDDALMRFIIRQFAEEAEDGREKFIFYVDTMSEKDQRERLISVFPSIRQFKVPKVFTYSGKFPTFAAECIKILKALDKSRLSPR